MANGSQSGFFESIETRRLFSVSTDIGIGPPPTDGGPSPAATVVVLTPSQTDTGQPHVTVTVVPTADKAPPTTEIVVTKHVDVSTPDLNG